MARDQETISLGSDWTEISNADVTGVFTLQVRTGQAEVRFTTSATAPAATENGIIFDEGVTLPAYRIADLAAGSGLVRIFARQAGATRTNIFIDHG